MKTGITLHYKVDPSEVCGGIFVDESEGFVPVEGPVFVKDFGSSRLWEYFDLDGVSRASLLQVDSGEKSPAWKIDVATDDVGYYEHHRVVAGAGRIACLRSAFSDGRQQKPVLADLSSVDFTEILPGDSFRVEASPFAENEFGTAVLATFPGAPFQDDFESQVTWPLDVLE